MIRNPTWARDEIILALDLYFQNGRRFLDQKHADVVELSHLLNTLPIHPTHVRQENFRNPAGVAMKIGNLMAFDTEQTSGLPSGGKGDKAVWDEFSGQPEELHRLATVIRQGAHTLSPPSSSTEEEDEGFPEGKIIERLHKRRERNRKLVTQKLKHVQQTTGALACEACGFEFTAVYGSLGKGFAECHHVRPLSETGEGKTKLQDLAVVCANCHRMIHRSRPMLTPAARRERLESKSKI